MKKLKDFEGQKIAIHCKTDDEIRAILKLNNSTMDAELVIRGKNRQSEGFEFAYRITDGWCSVKNYKNQGYTILPATDFLEEEFIYGQEYEFSYDKNFKRVFNEQFMCRLPNGIFVGWNGKEMSGFNYARKINTERTEAITTSKELITKFDIKKEELF